MPRACGAEVAWIWTALYSAVTPALVALGLALPALGFRLGWGLARLSE